MMPRWVWIAFLSIAIIGAGALWYFGDRSNDNNRLEIALVVTSLENPYFIEMKTGAEEAASKFENVDLIVSAPERGATDAERQLEIIRTLIQREVDALAVVPADSTQIIEGIALANSASVPFIVLDNDINRSAAADRGVEFAAFIGSNNRTGGELAGEFMADNIRGAGNIAILEGVAGVEAGIDRRDGFKSVIDSRQGLTIVASQVADWDREKAYNATLAIIAANPELNGIFGANDEMAIGAARAAADRGIRENLVIVGYDATPDGRDAVANGLIDATIAQQPFEVGAQGLQNAVALLSGDEIAKDVDIPLAVVSE